MTTSKDLESPSFESALQELEAIVKTMEQGDLPLEEALRQFERGIKLARSGQETLKNAEQKVQMLMEQHGQQQLVDMDSQSDS